MGKKDNKLEDQRYRTIQANTDAAAVKAESISPFEQEVNDYNMKLWNMYTGKDKFDLSKMPNASALMSMYGGAKERSDRGRIGKGLAYGGGAGAKGGYNANLIAAMDQQSQDERERDAAGALEQRVADTFGGIGGKMLTAGMNEQGRRSANFDRYNQMFGTAVQMKTERDKKPKWWELALSGAIGGVSGMAGV